MTYKICRKCNVAKPLIEFHRNRSARDGLQANCKPCHIAAIGVAQKKRRAQRLVEQKRYRDKYPERCKASDERWRERDVEHALKIDAAKAKRWRDRHPEEARIVSTNHAAKRRARCVSHVLPWADEPRMKVVYQKAKERGFHVDHVVPLHHPLVCGLHVWHNLQVLDPHLNRRKHNATWPDMPQ